MVFKRPHKYDRDKLDLYLEYENMQKARKSIQLGKHVVPCYIVEDEWIWGILMDDCGIPLSHIKNLPLKLRDIIIKYFNQLVNNANIIHNDITPRNILVPLKYYPFNANTNIIEMIYECKLIDFEIDAFVLDESDFQLASEKDCDLFYQYILKQRQKTEPVYPKEMMRFKLITDCQGYFNIGKEEVEHRLSKKKQLIQKMTKMRMKTKIAAINKQHESIVFACTIVSTFSHQITICEMSKSNFQLTLSRQLSKCN